MRKIVVMAILVTSMASACTNGPASGPQGSCYFSSEICYDLLDATDPEGFCASGGGTYRAVECATDARVGRCTVSGTDDDGAVLSYRINYYAPRTTEEVRTGCDATPSGIFERN